MSRSPTFRFRSTLYVDLAPGHAYDLLEDFAGQIPADAPKDAAEGAHVGGPFATDAFNRPALDGPLASSSGG